MENNTGYLSRAWKDLTTDKNWWQPVTILSLVSLIPFVGSLFVTGYLLDWAREAAWGMSRGLPHKVGDAGKRLKWGFFAVVIALAWILPISIILAMFVLVPVLGLLIVAVGCIAMIGLAAIVNIGCVNMTIYDRIKAGFQFNRLVGMAKVDTSGLVRAFCIGLIAVIPAFIYVMLCGENSISNVDAIYSTMGVTINGYQSEFLRYGLLGNGPYMGGVRMCLYLIMVFSTTLIQALVYRAYGHWIAQFQPAKWGGIDQPMPFEPGYVDRAAAPAAANDTRSTSYADVKEQVASAAATAGAFVKETAEKAADAASDAAAGLKPEQAGESAGDPEVIEAEVVSVSDAEPASEATAEAGAADEAASAAGNVASGAAADDDVSVAPRVAYCANCGAPVEEGHKFCVKCGYKL